MARKEDRKKQKRRRKEQKKAQKRAARDEFPRIEIVFDGEDEAFMLAVEQVIHSFDYANDEHCPESARNIYKWLRQFGAQALHKVFSSTDYSDVEEQLRGDVEQYARDNHFLLHFHIGTWLFKQLPEQYTGSPLPYFHYRVGAKGRGFILDFEFMPRKDVGIQKVWHSPFEPTVNIRGKEYRVGFTKHVFEQACKRMLLKHPLDYFQMRMVAEYFRQCAYFEPVLLEDGQDALRLFSPCAEGFGPTYVRDIAQLREPEIEAGGLSFILGYCPVVLDETGYAITKTLLFPGYANTPEAALVKRTRMNPILRSQLTKAAYDNTLGRVFIEKNIEPLRWYHHNGVPQVVRLNSPVMRDH